MLFTPEGSPAGNTDRIMLLAMWAKHLQKNAESKTTDAKAVISVPMIFAGMGRPTFPLHTSLSDSAIKYWESVGSRARQARDCLDEGKGDSSDKIAKIAGTVDYGNPKGDIETRSKVAQVLTNWYSSKVKVEANNVLFTVGGAGALHDIFSVINKVNPHGVIVTPFPHYSLYANPKNKLYPIHVMQQKGYLLTASLLDRTLQEARKNGERVSAFLLCDPSNPLGTVLSQEELKKIGDVLSRDENKDIWIVVDEAYTEMRLNGPKRLSLLTEAPQLANRIILMRSATKALSCAGERMAITLAFDKNIMARLTEENIDICGHAPRSLQVAFADALEKLDDKELDKIIAYYKPQVDYVFAKLKEIGAAMPNPSYKTEGAFYVVADMSDLLGMELPIETQAALGQSEKITTDEDIAYYLMFKDAIMIAPLSYFGLSNKCGYLRITCSGGNEELVELMKRIENRLVEARKLKKEHLLKGVEKLLGDIRKVSSVDADRFAKEIEALISSQNTSNKEALKLKAVNQALQEMISKMKDALKAHSKEEKLDLKNSRIVLGFLGRRVAKKWKKTVDNEWKNYVEKSDLITGSLKASFFSLKPSQRLEFSPWKDHIKKHFSSR